MFSGGDAVEPETEKDKEPESCSTADTETDSAYNRLQQFLKANSATLSSSPDTWSKEIAQYAAGGPRTTSLSELYTALKGVPPTSVEAERVFSVTGQFYT